MYYYIISQSELERYRKNPDTILIDLRSPDAFRRGHIPNAVNIPYQELRTRPVSAFTREKIILYCDKGNQSLLAARDLQNRGITAFSVYGGFYAYRGPVEQTVNQAIG